MAVSILAIISAAGTPSTSAIFSSDLQQNDDVGALDAPLHHADERPVQPRGRRELLLGHCLSLPAFAQDNPERPLGASRGLHLRSIFDPLSGSQTNILGCTLF
jgi:hypothetical protein